MGRLAKLAMQKLAIDWNDPSAVRKFEENLRMRYGQGYTDPTVMNEAKAQQRIFERKTGRTFTPPPNPNPPPPKAPPEAPKRPNPSMDDLFNRWRWEQGGGQRPPPGQGMPAAGGAGAPPPPPPPGADAAAPTPDPSDAGGKRTWRDRWAGFKDRWRGGPKAPEAPKAPKAPSAGRMRMRGGRMLGQMLPYAITGGSLYFGTQALKNMGEADAAEAAKDTKLPEAAPEEAPVPTDTASGPSFWDRNKEVILAGGAGVGAIGLLAYLLSQEEEEKPRARRMRPAAA